STKVCPRMNPLPVGDQVRLKIRFEADPTLYRAVDLYEEEAECRSLVADRAGFQLARFYQIRLILPDFVQAAFTDPGQWSYSSLIGEWELVYWAASQSTISPFLRSCCSSSLQVDGVGLG